MSPRSFRTLILSSAVLFLSLAITTLHTTPAEGQNYCGPNTVVNFNNTNGAYPYAGVSFDSQGNMFGTTENGGASGFGTVWKYTSSAGLTQVFNFSGSSSPSNNGDRPISPLLIDTQGNLYGSTYDGGNNFSGDGSGYGTLFKLSSSGQFTELHQFSGPEGANALGRLTLDSSGNIWGTTYQGGTGWNPPNQYGDGTVFKYSNGSVTNPVLFNITDGENVQGGMATDGTSYYGTTYQGGANGFGTLFQYNSTTGQLTTLFNFNRNPNGSYPLADVLYDGKGNLYGTTSGGGGHSSASNGCCGTVWKYSLSSGTLTTLVSFDGDTVPADGISPQGGVTLDSNGNLFGTTSQGGSFSDGIVYEYSSTGTLSTLATFNGTNGQFPQGNLTFDSSGNLWGITHQGGNPGYGTVYKLTPSTGGGCGATISSVTFNPASIPNGGTSTGTVTLSAAAPSGGSVVSLSDDNPSVLNVPSSVTVPAGATTGTFQAAAKNAFVLSNTVVTTTATLGSSTAQGTVTVTTGIAVTGISVKPSSVTAGNSTTGTVTIASAAPSGGNEVLISTNNNNTAAVKTMQLPITVTVPAGQSSVSFSIGTNCETSGVVAPIYGQSGGATVSTNLTVNAAGSCGTTVSSVTLNPTSVTGGNNSTGTVTLSSAAPSGGSVVSLSSNSSSATVPSSVTIAAGSTSTNFTVTTTSVTATTTATITATLGSSSQQATLTINPASSSVTLASLTLNPTSVSGGSNSTGTVTLTGAAPSGGASVSLSSSNTSVATVPSTVTVSAGQTSASFTVTTQRVFSNTNVTISATYNGTTQNATLTVTSGRH